MPGLSGGQCLDQVRTEPGKAATCGDTSKETRESHGACRAKYRGDLGNHQSVHHFQCSQKNCFRFLTRPQVVFHPTCSVHLWPLRPFRSRTVHGIFRRSPSQSAPSGSSLNFALNFPMASVDPRQLSKKNHTARLFQPAGYLGDHIIHPKSCPYQDDSPNISTNRPTCCRLERFPVASMNFLPSLWINSEAFSDAFE